MPLAPPPPEPITRWGGGHQNGQLWLKATGVALAGQGLAIVGASGTGKSGLAIQLISLGANLIADDALWLDPTQDPALLRRPDQSPDLIEARGIGLINAGQVEPSAPLRLIVDLDRPEIDRLPPRRLVAIGNGQCPLILGAGNPTLAASLILLLRNGRADI